MSSTSHPPSNSLATLFSADLAIFFHSACIASLARVAQLGSRFLSCASFCHNRRKTLRFTASAPLSCFGFFFSFLLLNATHGSVRTNLFNGGQPFLTSTVAVERTYTLFSALADLDTSDASHRASCESDSFRCLDKFMLICSLMVVCRFVLFSFFSLPPSVSLSPLPFSPVDVSQTTLSARNMERSRSSPEACSFPPIRSGTFRSRSARTIPCTCAQAIFSLRPGMAP